MWDQLGRRTVLWERYNERMWASCWQSHGGRSFDMEEYHRILWKKETLGASELLVNSEAFVGLHVDASTRRLMFPSHFTSFIMSADTFVLSLHLVTFVFQGAPKPFWSLRLLNCNGSNMKILIHLSKWDGKWSSNKQYLSISLKQDYKTIKRTQ